MRSLGWWVVGVPVLSFVFMSSPAGQVIGCTLAAMFCMGVVLWAR